MSRKRNFDVIIHEAEEGGFWAECPALSGCYSQGESIEEVKSNIKEAMDLYIEDLREKKKRIPVQRKIYITSIAI
jgi:predicted RNase H-like HicB family nuclease